MAKNLKTIRKRMLSRVGLTRVPYSRELVVPAKLPSAYRKTSEMRLFEFHFKVRIEDVINQGSLNAFVAKYSNDDFRLDRSTISRWRNYFKHMREHGGIKCKRCVHNKKAVCPGFRRGCPQNEVE